MRCADYEDIAELLGCRPSLSRLLRERHAGHIPVVVESSDISRDGRCYIHKMLLPPAFTVGELHRALRMHVDHLDAHQALFLFAGGKALAVYDTLAAVDTRSRDSDGFVYVILGLESVFGGVEEGRHLAGALRGPTVPHPRPAPGRPGVPRHLRHGEGLRDPEIEVVA